MSFEPRDPDSIADFSEPVGFFPLVGITNSDQGRDVMEFSTKINCPPVAALQRAYMTYNDRVDIGPESGIRDDVE